MFTLPILIVLLPTPSLPAGDARATATKGLAFLQKSSVAWREDKKCVTCHQVPFTLWAAGEARQRGFPSDAKADEELTAWAFDFCKTNKHEGQPTGGFHLTMVFMVLSQAGNPSPTVGTDAYPLFVTLFAKRQRPEGSWREGNQVRLPGGEREADEVDTLWTLLAIRHLEQLGEKLPKDARESLAAMRAKATAFLKDAKPGRRTDWVTLRALVAREYGTATEADALVKDLKGLQRPDGGWGFVRDGASYPHTTGECLYALGRLGVGEDDAAVSRARSYLVGTQDADGSWECRSRSSFATQPKKMNAVTIHWGTAWATIGLLKTLSPGREGSSKK